MTSSDPRPRRRPAAPAFLVALLALGSWPLAAEEAGEIRSFAVVHRPLEDAYAQVWPLLSDHAEVRMIRAEKRLEVRDDAVRLEAVARALLAFDVAPRLVRLNVRAIRGEKRDAAVVDPPAAGVPGVPRDVRELLGFNVFETIGSVDLAVREGSAAGSPLGPADGFRVEVELGAVDPRAGTIEVKLLSFDRGREDPAGVFTYTPVFRFREDLASGRPRVLCATPGGENRYRRALFLVVTGSVE
jgi:hypothetical protein